MGKIKNIDLIAKDSRWEAKHVVRARQKQRMKKRAQKVYPHMTPERAATLADHIKVCSCPWCCGNPRLFYGDSMQEIRAKAAMSLDLEDWL